MDDLEAGNSYFMNELNKLKIAIEMLLQQDRSLIIFDELFRGTNYQDATTISNTTINGLSKSKNSDIIISTHLDNFVHNNAALQETSAATILFAKLKMKLPIIPTNY